jgi:hypothetical protein
VLQHKEFRHLRSDVSIFVWEDTDSKVIVPVFVDDITLASKSKPKIQMLKTMLAKHFKLRNLGVLKQLLGVEILRNRAKGELGLTQRGYAQDILAYFGLSDCRPMSTLLDPSTYLNACRGCIYAHCGLCWGGESSDVPGNCHTSRYCICGGSLVPLYGEPRP